MFYLSLLPPEGGAKLGAVNRKTIVIERNDAPYGLIEIFISGSRYAMNPASVKVRYRSTSDQLPISNCRQENSASSEY